MPSKKNIAHSLECIDNEVLELDEIVEALKIIGMDTAAERIGNSLRTISIYTIGIFKEIGYDGR